MVVAQNECLTPENLLTLDSNWEKAQLELDIEFMESTLDEDYIWIHNHANTIDDKTAVINRIQRYIDDNREYSSSRTTEDVKATVSGSTGIVSGYTTVDNGTTVTTYYFLRTYIATNGFCVQLANQTMVIPEAED